LRIVDGTARILPLFYYLANQNKSIPMSKFFSSKLAPNSVNTGLLIIRVVFGIMLCVHGWQKLANFTDMAPKFYDPLHVTPTVSLALTVFAEFFCSALVVLGLFTRLAAIPVVFLMCVVTYVVNR